MALWTDIMDPAELTGFARTALEALDVSPLNVALPNIVQDEVKFSYRKGSTVSDVAQYGDFDTESSIGDGPGGEEFTMRLLPVMRKMPLSEYEQITQPDQVRERAFEKTEAAVRAVIRRLSLIRGEALQTGGLAINERGVNLNVSFDRAAAQTDASPGDDWDSNDADPVANLVEWADLMSDNTGGLRPTQIIMSTKAATAAGAALADAGYITTSAPVVSRDLVNEVLQSHSLPTITVFDGKVGGQRVIGEDHVIMVAAGEAGGTIFGPTVEAQDPRYNLAGGDQNGIVSGLYREDDPPIAWALGKAVALPVLTNPNATLSAKVFS